ncbi:hypothetical protein EDD18DRAFT_1346758 [Armillaria luteobubalina]|uniref:Uncharacterized protein n=1 Tax=Armillaria luteobubalina TaxID=153913 RepID=A0AA39UT82_9AGAR|nr:hypothetical protein EDD18DRAFT_1346758 [Armillaria luteobubalina]
MSVKPTTLNISELLDKAIREEEAKVAKDLGLVLPDDPDTDSSGVPRKKLKSSRLVKSGRILQISRDLAKTLLLEQTEEVKQDMHQLYLKDSHAVHSIIDDLRPWAWSLALMDHDRSFMNVGYKNSMIGIQILRRKSTSHIMIFLQPSIVTPQRCAKFEASLQMVDEGPEDLNNTANDEFNENMEDVDIPELNPHQQPAEQDYSVTVVSEAMPGSSLEGVTRAGQGFRFLDEMGMRQFILPSDFHCDYTGPSRQYSGFAVNSIFLSPITDTTTLDTAGQDFLPII